MSLFHVWHWIYEYRGFFIECAKNKSSSFKNKEDKQQHGEENPRVEEFNRHNDNYQRFETWFIYKIKYEIYIVTEIIEKLSV